tara:strand:- start:33 stop:167 length:135 start_codon:yes stop_codon:yes gene_type:complete
MVEVGLVANMVLQIPVQEPLILVVEVVGAITLVILGSLAALALS